MDLTFEQLKELIILGVGQLILLIGALSAAYIKVMRDINKKIDNAEKNVKNHTDMSVQKLNGMVSYIIHGHETPAWIKVAEKDAQGNVQFRMMELNEHYAAAYGINRLDYIGKTDLEAGWPKEVADEFRANDLIVWASGKPATFEEEFPNGQNVHVRKILLKTPNGQMKGIMGFVANSEELDFNYPTNDDDGSLVG